MPRKNLRHAVSAALRARASQPVGAWGTAARVGTAAALLAFGGAAYAQQAPDGPNGQAPAQVGELEEVVVTGIRRSIETAIEAKREATSIVEAISAEDLGKLPDTSIADSLSRLPGLTSQRAEGRASAISLRGTDPGFTSTLLNGREQVSTGDNRGVEFDQYPSELLSAVLVYKTPDAQLIGQGLAGTVDLRTQRPLDYGRRAVAFNIRGEQNSNDDLGADADERGYRISLSYIDQFLDDRLGVAVGVARLNSPLAVRGFGTYEPWSAWNPNPGQPNFNAAVPRGTFITNGAKVRSDMGENTRDGAMAAIQFKPNDAYETMLDVYYTKREQENNARSLEVNLGDYPGPCCDGPFPAGTQFGYANPVVVDNVLVGASLINRVPLARNFLFTTDDEIFAAGWNNKFTFGEWRLTADLSYSKAERDEVQYETNAQIVPQNVPGQARNIYDNGTIALRSDDFSTLTFTRNYADPATVQVGPTIYGAGYSKIPSTTDELTSFRLDLDRAIDWWWFDGASVGLNYADRSKDKVQPEGGLSTRNNNAYFRVGNEFLLSPTNLSYAGAGQALAWDVKGVLGAYYQPIVYGTPTTPGFDYLIGKNWLVEEKVTSGYFRATLNRDVSDTVRLRGNVGVQVVQTDQSSDALFKAPTGAVRPFTNGKKYTDVLPAINLAFLLPESQAVRVGVSRQIARARMDQLKAASEFGVDQTTGRPGGSGGNPELDPWRANAFDVSYEKYFEGNKGYFSVAAFYKDLKSYIYNVGSDFDFSDFLAQTTFPPNFFPPGIQPQRVGTFTRPVNGDGGSLKGAEVAVSVPSEMFFENVRGFGVILSYSYTDSDIEIVDPPGNGFLVGNNLGRISLPGLSKNVWNATAYYENAGFSARVAMRSRSDYIGELPNFANERAFKFVDGDRITDAQLGYAFQGGAFEGLSVLLQVNNLTNEPYVAYARNELRVQDVQDYGRQYLIGINYRL